MTFNQYKDAKSVFAAIETWFGGNEATKKTQKTLLKQMYENFSATSTESLDFIFNRLQKIVSQLAVLDTMSIDDLYNNFKIVDQEVKRTASSNSSSQNMAFVSSPSTNSTNDVYTAYGVSTASTQSSTASTKLVLISLKWSATTTIRWDILQDSAEGLGTKIVETGIKIALEGLRMWKKPLLRLWMLLMELVLTRAIWLKIGCLDSGLTTATTKGASVLIENANRVRLVSSSATRVRLVLFSATRVLLVSVISRIRGFCYGLAAVGRYNTD
nr:hypothetical protein [Tanacetum cinerariifolium]